MDLISSLKQSRPTEGLTPSNLNHLEQVFKDAVGDKKEIDLEDFKKIVQSRNMFFVERIFKIFDTDRSGSISFDEFMRVMRGFSRQTPHEKLGYLFKVYDLNDDGTIQFSELRDVISECMKENGLAFNEYEIEELTKMLFEDADKDGSGSITYSKFQDQLRRHPAFVENLTLSVERWLLPPKSSLTTRQQAFTRFCPRKLQWKHIKNNWTSVIFLLMYFLTNIGFFAFKVIEFSDHNVFYILARGCGQCLNFNCTFVLVLVLRQTLTWLRTHGFAVYLPLDQHLYYHKVTGCCILGYSALHTIMHICNFSTISRIEGIPLHKLLISTEYRIGWVNGSACLTGWVLLLILGIVMLSSLPIVRRNGKFEIFYCLHQLTLLFWVFLILHASNFWKWFLAPAILYAIETIIRMRRYFFSNKKAYVQRGILLPSNVTKLVIKRPPKFDFKPGDYIYINIPTIAKFEWHPFTISSAPEMDDVLWLHIRGVGGWTNSLYQYFVRHVKEAVPSKQLPKIDSSGNVDSLLDVKTKSTESSSRSHPSSIIPVSPTFSNQCEIQMKNLVGRSASETSAAKMEQDTFCMWSPSLPNSANVEIEILNASKTSSCFRQETSISPIPRSPALSQWDSRRRTSFGSVSLSPAIRRKNTEDSRNVISEGIRTLALEEKSSNFLRLPNSENQYKRKKSVRISVADRGLRRCQTIIVMPTVNEDEDDAPAETTDVISEEDLKEIERQGEMENVIVTPQLLKIYIDGPYGSPTRHIFQSSHAVLIATGIGVTPFASILQSIMFHYRKSKNICPKCGHRWTDCNPISNVHLRKVDFFWLNRHQRSFEWFVSLLSELEVQQEHLKLNDRFLDIHMYITSAHDRTDMKAVGLQMALDLLYQKEKRCLITGLKSRTQPGRPDWEKVFTNIAQQNKGKVTVFFCGPPQLAKTLQVKCNEFGFRFRKEIF